MKKFKSITDVITNSSTEVFTLETDASIADVLQFLKENTEGFCEPEIMTIDKGILEYLHEFGYLYDITSEKDNKLYMLQNWDAFAEEPFDYEYDYIIKHGGSFLRNFYINYVKDHIDEYVTALNKDIENTNKKHPYLHSDNIWDVKKFLKYFNEYQGFENTNFWPSDHNYFDFMVNDEMSEIQKLTLKFIEEYKNIGHFKKYPEMLPSWWTIPEINTVQYWEGKIGFQGINDNSIPYEDWDKINNKFGGTHWHMG